MNIEEMKNKIRFAVDAVQDIPEPFKIKAFEIILPMLLEETKPEKRKEGQKDIVQSEPARGPQGIEDRIRKLAEAAGITVTQLKDVFQFEEKEPKFIGAVRGTEAEKQVQVSSLVMLALRDVYGEEWVEGSHLLEALRDHGIGSLDNLARNLKARENEFRMTGQGRGKKYKVTEPGRQYALSLLKQLVAG